ncbi:MAG: response regulator [Archangiaceae bacterium]|nr:response regulator [Archangiaceae bacterium]
MAKKILVVDDSPLVLNLVRETLAEAGYEVTTADNPLILPNLIRHTVFDLALVDLNMPTIQGDVVTTILERAGLPTTRVVLFSEAPAEELRDKARACKALGFVKKGTEEHLLKELAHFLTLAH